MLLCSPFPTPKRGMHGAGASRGVCVWFGMDDGCKKGWESVCCEMLAKHRGQHQHSEVGQEGCVPPNRARGAGGCCRPCCASVPPAAADPKPQKQRPGRSYLTLLLSPQVSRTNKKGFSVKRSRKALFLVLVHCREMRRFLEQERLCLFPRFLRLVL